MTEPTPVLWRPKWLSISCLLPFCNHFGRHSIRRAILEQSFEISDGHPQLTFTCLCWKWKCIQNLCQMHQKAAGLGCILHVLDYWESIAHKYDSLWRQSLIPQLFGATDINFEHIPTFSIDKHRCIFWTEKQYIP